MKHLLLTLIMVMTLSFGGVSTIPADQDAANHALIGAAMTKAVSAFFDDDTTFLIVWTLFIAKELTDRTGFSINDLVYDGVGYGLVKFELKF